MAKRRASSKTTTDFSFADSYLEDRKYGRWERVEVKFPLIPDRRPDLVNIQFSDEEFHRTWRGEVPTVGISLGEEDIISGPISLDSGEYQFRYVNPNQKNTPSDYIATLSGVEPLINPPGTVDDQQGGPTNNPLVINKEFSNDSNSAEFIVAKNIVTDNMRGERYPYRVYDESVGSREYRLSWATSPSYDTPTYPRVRYPNKGAYRIRTKLTPV